MHATFRAIYLPALAKFVASRDVRAYLAGILIEPAPDHMGGVYLVAIDGHTACLIHDPEGSSDGIYIMETPHLLAGSCRPHSSKDIRTLGEKMLTFDGSMATLSDKTGPICAEKCRPIKTGKQVPFDWRKALIPKMPMHEPAPFASVQINVEYLERCSQALRAMGQSIKAVGYFGCEIFPTQSNGKFVLVPKTLDNHRIYFVVMPMRNDSKPEELNWLAMLDDRWQPPGPPWIQWTGLTADLEAIGSDTDVEVRLANGTVTKAKASSLNWGMAGLPTDIIEYRILEAANG
jgi:hypothetical protein